MPLFGLIWPAVSQERLDLFAEVMGQFCGFHPSGSRVANKPVNTKHRTMPADRDGYK